MRSNHGARPTAAPGFGQGKVGLYAEPGALEIRLHELGVGDLFVDAASPWLAEPDDPIRVGDPMLVPRQTYRALFYLDDAAPMTPLYG